MLHREELYLLSFELFFLLRLLFLYRWLNRILPTYT